MTRVREHHVIGLKTECGNIVRHSCAVASTIDTTLNYVYIPLCKILWGAPNNRLECGALAGQIKVTRDLKKCYQRVSLLWFSLLL